MGSIPARKRESLKVLEDQYRNELLTDEERQELRDRIGRLKREAAAETVEVH